MASLENGTKTKRIVKNTIILYVRLLVTSAIALFSSRIVLKALGVTDYGVFSLVCGIVTLCSCVTTTMASSTQRFLSYEIGNGSLERLKKVFSTSVNAHLIIVFFIVLITETIGLWYLNNKINIPLDRVEAAKVIYQFSVFSLAFSFLTIPFSAVVIAYEEMGFYSVVSIFDSIFKLVVAYIVLYSCNMDRLILYGFLIMLEPLANLILYIIYCRKRHPVIKYSFTYDRQLFKNLFGFSIWILIGQIAIIIANQGINLVLNLFFPVVVNAAMGISSQVNGVVSSLASNVQTATKPQLVKSYSIGDYSYLTNLITMSSKLAFYILFVFAVPFIINIDWILNIWLESVPEYTGIFCSLWIIDTLFNAIGSSSGTAVEATGRIRSYQIIISLLFLSNIVIIYFVLKIGLPPYFALIVKVVISFIVAIVRVYYVSLYIKTFSIFGYFKSVLIPIISSVSLIVLFAFMFQSIYLMHKLIFTIGISMLTIVSIMFIGLSKTERYSTIAFCRGIINNRLLKLLKH